MLLVMLLFASPALFAQRGVPVPVPRGVGNLIPDWVMFLFLGVIALLIAVSFLKWFGERFRDFKSFTELLGILSWIGGTLLFLKVAHWNFWWCLAAGFATAALFVSFVEYIYKQAKTK